MEELINQAANIGFPIVVSAYLLVRMEAKLDQLTASIVSLANAVGHNIDKK